MGAVKKALFFLLILFLFSSLTKTIMDYYHNMDYYQAKKKEYEDQKKRNITLKTQVIKNNDPYQLEKTIRNDLGLNRDNEVPIIVPLPTVVTPTPSPTPLPNWQQWRNLFFSAN